MFFSTSPPPHHLISCCQRHPFQPGFFPLSLFNIKLWSFQHHYDQPEQSKCEEVPLIGQLFDITSWTRISKQASRIFRVKLRSQFSDLGNHVVWQVMTNAEHMPCINMSTNVALQNILSLWLTDAEQEGGKVGKFCLQMSISWLIPSLFTFTLKNGHSRKDKKTTTTTTSKVFFGVFFCFQMTNLQHTL